MAERAHVTSIEAIEAFRASLIVYLSRARPVLDDAWDEVIRLRQWLQNDRRLHWENQIRRRTKQLEEAQQALFSANLANLREPTAQERMAVVRTKHALEQAQEKLKEVKRWTREFDSRVEPMAKPFEHLRTLLANDLPKAAAHLAQVVKTLDDYAAVKPAPAAIADSSELAGVSPSPPKPSLPLVREGDEGVGGEGQKSFGGSS
jgi:hypothetical protein